MATQASLDKVQELFIAYYGRPADLAGQTYWADELEASSLEEIIDRFATSDEFDEQYGDLTNQQLIAELYKQILDRDPADTPDDEGPAWYAEQLSEGLMTRGEIALAILAGATGDDAAVLENRKAVADLFTQAVEDAGKVYEVEAGKALLASVGADTDPATVDVAAAVAALDDAAPTTPTTGEELDLTQRADALTGTDADDTFNAPVTQNETGSGALANTFETGDVLNGGEGVDTLNADLIATGTIQDNQNGVAISAETDGIENVFLRAQAFTADTGANNTTFAATVDAEKMAGVQEWWSDNSRANIVIEDIRSATEDTTFGMRQTDPAVSFINYFNPLYLTGEVDNGASSFSFVIAETDDAAAELANINVFAINFEYEGVNYSLDSEAVKEADTWAELQTALQAEIDADAALAGLTVTHNGGGNFVVTDPAAGTFDIDPTGTVVTSSTTLETKDAVLGRLAPEEGPTITNVVLDGAGNGSQGGVLNIGAMSGGRGVEVFNVDVDRDSHLTQMSSVNGAPYNALVPNEYLEVVNLNSIGANGDLQIGARTATLDERANTTGLTNVREVNGEDFAGDLNIGINLGDNVISRYLDEAESDIEFSYTAGAGNDLFNIVDQSTAGSVSQDQDFTMSVDMGAGDDRLVINVPFVDETTVDGGDGENSIVVSQSHGTNGTNTFEGFANFQTYEVEGTTNTTHDFTSMPGVENVVVATGTSAPAAGGNTTLIDLEAAQDVTISGKNQTIGNQSTADQNFGTITLTDDAGVERTVTLDNTARLSNAAVDGVSDQDGILFVQGLTVNASATGVSATRELTIESTGERNVANAIGAVNAAGVNTLNLSGTQELTVDVLNLATAPATNQAPLNIDGSELTGDLHLGLNGALLNQITGTGTDTIMGTDGANDTLMLYGTFTGGNNATVNGFETIQLGSYGSETGTTADDTLFGDIVQGMGAPKLASGTLDAAGFNTNSFVIADVAAAGVTLNNLGNNANITLGDANTDDLGSAVNAQALTEAVTLQSGTGTVAGSGIAASAINIDFAAVLNDSQTHNLTVNGYQALNVNVAHAADELGVNLGADTRTLNLTLDADARTLNLTGGLDHYAATAAYDVLTLGVDIPNSIEVVDLSGFAGTVDLDMETDVEAVANETDVKFIMSQYDAVVDLSNDSTAIIDFATGANASNLEHNSVFVFTAERGDTADVTTWAITNFVADFDGGANDALTDINNLTRLDLTDLGITSFDQVDISFDGTDTLIRSESQVDNSAVTWQIEISGIDLSAAGVISADNFIFS